MPNPEEQQRIEENLDVIRTYLKHHFPSCTIDETSDLSISYNFTVTNLKEYKSYKLKVGGSRLSDKGNSPAKTQAELTSNNIAERMIEANGDCVWF
jgi:hypothetical protein